MIRKEDRKLIEREHSDMLTRFSTPESRSLLERKARAKVELAVRKERRKQEAVGGLIEFIKYFWDILEPNREFKDGWVLHAICKHLEAVTDGRITRLLINVPPGSM